MVSILNQGDFLQRRGEVHTDGDSMDDGWWVRRFTLGCWTNTFTLGGCKYLIKNIMAIVFLYVEKLGEWIWMKG